MCVICMDRPSQDQADTNKSAVERGKQNEKKNTFVIEVMKWLETMLASTDCAHFSDIEIEYMTLAVSLTLQNKSSVRLIVDFLMFFF